MNIALWIAQGFLAAVFLFSGICKSTQSERWLAGHGQTGVEGLPLLLIRFIGVMEILGACGIIFPWLTKISPVLTPVSALGFCIIMFLAAIVHYRRNEKKTSLGNIFLLLVSAFAAYGRFSGL